MKSGITISRTADRRRSSRPVRPRQRAGYLSMELVLTLPILAIVLLALFEFSLLFMGRSLVVESCRAGARHGTLNGATPQSVEREVRKVLSPTLQQNLKVNFTPAARPGGVVQVVVYVPMDAAAPDLLWPVGFGLEGRELIAESRMIKE